MDERINISELRVGDVLHRVRHRAGSPHIETATVTAQDGGGLCVRLSNGVSQWYATAATIAACGYARTPKGAARVYASWAADALADAERTLAQARAAADEAAALLASLTGAPQ